MDWPTAFFFSIVCICWAAANDLGVRDEADSADSGSGRGCGTGSAGGR
jgi:hypothetical protein